MPFSRSGWAADWRRVGQSTWQRLGPWVVAGGLGAAWIWYDREQAKKTVVTAKKMSKKVCRSRVTLCQCLGAVQEQRAWNEDVKKEQQQKKQVPVPTKS